MRYVGGLLMIALIFFVDGMTNKSLADPRFYLDVQDNVAFAYGRTDAASYNDILAQLEQNPQIDTIILRHVAGTYHLGVNNRIAQLIRSRGIKTRLEKRSFVASGGVDLFLAGVERTMECGARLAVHSWRDERTGVTPDQLSSDPLERLMIDFHHSLGIGPDYYPFTRNAAPHDKLYYLSQDDVRRFGLITSERCERVGFLWW